MSADLTELYKAHKVAREDLALTEKALSRGVSSRIGDACVILSECERVLTWMQGADTLDWRDLLADLLDELRKMQRALAGDENADETTGESEVADD